MDPERDNSPPFRITAEKQMDDMGTKSVLVDEQNYDHLRQLFITKNDVLCSEVKKSFYDLCYGDKLGRDIPKVPDNTKFNRIVDIPVHNFPLFITSRDFLLLLDVSLGAETFFQI